jgi:cytochrome c-550 PedF
MSILKKSKILATLTAAVLSVAISQLAISQKVMAHGDGAPQPVDTTGLKELGKDWLKRNPYKGNEKAIEIGSSGYNSNCARCHGLEVKSGGASPDLRYLEDDTEGDEWYINRVRKGYHQNGVTKMPKFEGLISQEAMWAIRTYIDSRPE